MGKQHKSANNFRCRSRLRENRCSNRDYYLANRTPKITDWLEIEKRLVRLISDPNRDPAAITLLDYVLCISILQLLIGVSNEEADFSVNNTTTTPFTKMTASKGTSGLSPRLTVGKTFGESSKKKTGTYATQPPVSFISSGKMESEPEIYESRPRHQTASSSSSYGAFEMHTTGFGSRMMAKMGYVDGGGLGKDGRGIAEPIQPIQRPKSLGLGAMAAPETESADTTPPQFRSFERQTKGFGSKMMAKMGYIEGTGLGRDSQGIVDPLVASRLPKSRGLGASCCIFSSE